MPPVFVQVAGAGLAGGPASATATLPAVPAAGHALVAVAACQASGAINTPAGWTLLASGGGGSVLPMAWFGKLSRGAADQSLTVTAGGWLILRLAEYSGVTLIVKASGVGTSGVQHGAQTPPVPNSLGDLLVAAAIAAAYAPPGYAVRWGAGSLMLVDGVGPLPGLVPPGVDGPPIDYSNSNPGAHFTPTITVPGNGQTVTLTIIEVGPGAYYASISVDGDAGANGLVNAGGTWVFTRVMPNDGAAHLVYAYGHAYGAARIMHVTLQAPGAVPVGAYDPTARWFGGPSLGIPSSASQLLLAAPTIPPHRLHRW